MQTEPKVFVGMIPPGTNEDDLRNLFSPYGELTDVHVMRTPSGEGKGYLHLNFFNFKFFSL
jgi:RNA recognition motif-containing protein